MGIGDAARSQGDIMYRLQEIERTIRDLQTARRLEAATVGRGGIRVRGTGGVRVQDGGGVAIEGGGDVGVAGGGRVHVQGGGGVVVEDGGNVDVEDGGAIIARHPNRQVGAVYGTLAAIGTGGAEAGHGLLVQANDGLDIFRAKQDDQGAKTVFVGTSVSGTPHPVETFRARAEFAGFHCYGTGTNGQFRVEADTDIVLLPQSPSGSQGVWIGHSTTSATTPVCIIGTTGLIQRSTSSRRYKTDIEDHHVDPGLVLGLRPRSWRDAGEVEADPDTGNRYAGLVAEEVDELGLSEFVTYDPDGQPDGVAYDRLVVGLLEVVQAQQSQIDALSAWASARGYTPPDRSAPGPSASVKAVPSPAPRPREAALTRE
jgi:hypothetical protein